MPATNTLAEDFKEDLLLGVHQFETHSIRFALSNTAPASEASNPLTAGNGVLANVTEIAYTNYADDLATDRTLEGVDATAAGLDFNDFQIQAAGGPLAAFRYLWVYNDTPTSPADPVIGVIDLGQEFTLADTEFVPIQIAAAGLFSAAVA